MLSTHPVLVPLLNRLAVRLKGTNCTPQLMQDLEFCDRFLAELAENPHLEDSLRVEVYTQLLSPGPGGLRAFAWLVARGHAGPELVVEYLSCQKPGAPTTGALDEGPANGVAEALFAVCLSPAQQLACAAQLLASQSLAEVSRLTLFRRMLAGALVAPEVRGQLVSWSTEATVPGVVLPPAPPELFRAGTLARVQGGEAAELVLRQVLSCPEQRVPDRISEVTLDLIDLYGNSVERSLRFKALDWCRQQPDSKVRRRAYQLAERSEGESFLRLGLRDQDFGVRSWVLARVTRKRTTA